MGINTVAVLYNDMIHLMRSNSKIGDELAAAITHGWSSRDRLRFAKHFTGGMVISQAHADYSQIVVVGRNSGAMLADGDNFYLPAVGVRIPATWLLCLCRLAPRQCQWRRTMAS